MAHPQVSSALIHPVILCGGSGARLWPLSRKETPKPFLSMLGERTLFESALGRVADKALFAAPLIVANAAHVPLIEAQVPAGMPYRLLVEPAARNTAPAIALAAALLPDDAIMLVCPSDHHIADEAAFGAGVQAAAMLAAQDYLVSFGITPDRPETGYGYLQRGGPLPGGYAIGRFVEKPSRDVAQAYLASGEYSWNGGIFAFRAGMLLSELARYRPAMAEAVRAAAAGGQNAGAQFHPAPAPFIGIASESIDYAVMENTARAAMVPVEMGWSDIGNFAAVHDALAAMPGVADADGNVSAGNGIPADFAACSNVLALSDSLRVSVVGLEDVCVIVAGGEVLVTSRERAQLVGTLPGAVAQ